MGAKLTNKNTGQNVTMVSAGQTRPLLEVRVNDTVELAYTVTNTGSTTGRFVLTWATGDGDISTSSVTLSPNQSASGSLTKQYTSTKSQFTTTVYVTNVDTNKITDIKYADIVVKGEASFRIDDPPLLLNGTIRSRLLKRLLG